MLTIAIHVTIYLLMLYNVYYFEHLSTCISVHSLVQINASKLKSTQPSFWVQTPAILPMKTCQT